LLLAGDARGGLRVAWRCGGAPEARFTLGWALILAGRGATGYPLARGGLPPTTSLPLGRAATWMEDYETARRDLDAAIPRLRARSDARGLRHALAAAAEHAFRTGDWQTARIYANEAYALGDGAQLALLDAVTGTSLLDRTSDLAAHARLGLTELGVGDAARALAHLEGARRIALRTGVREPNIVRWAPDLIETQVRLGRATEAERTLVSFDRLAAFTGRRWALAAARRCHGLLVAPGAVDETFERAERLTRDEPSAFERGRLLLCWGERLRRDGRRVEARRRLGAALDGFEALGARPWAERAAGELRAGGARARRGPKARGDTLTAQELQVALVVCEGLTNKAVGARLFLSPRTVETHLAHAFRKLGVHTRTELAHVLSSRESSSRA
jgi:DNA-binding CsgD family transcriptional regulator